MQIHVPALQPQELIAFAGLSITNTLLTSWIAILLLIVLVLGATYRMRIVPGRMQSAAELVVEGLAGLVEQGGGPAARRFLPLIGTLFLYILTANWMGVIPGVGSLQFVGPGEHEIAPFRSANSDLSITAAMAIIVFIWVQVTGLRASPKAYFQKFVWPPGLNVLDLIAELVRPIALALRLFGNIFAGFILVEVVLQLAPPLFPAAALGFELFVGLVQALVFAILAVAFLALATAHGHSEEHSERQSSH